MRTEGIYYNLAILPLFSVLLSCASEKKENIVRPRDPWAFRSVLDKKPRMLTLALDTACYAAYDLASCTLYKVWKGGVALEGAAYTDKKNVQPTSWGASYSDSLQNRWLVSVDGKPDSFKIINKGYRFMENRIYIKYSLVLSSGDSIAIEERPEFIKSENAEPGLERTFTTSNVPANVLISLSNGKSSYKLPANSSSALVSWFKTIPTQSPPISQAEYDHRGRYWMEKSDCFTCHEVDRKTVGPSFQEVAGKYEEHENPYSNLITKIKLGSTGAWGTSAMTPHPDLAESEIRVMLDYIFSLKPKKSNLVTTVPKKKSDYETSPGFGEPLAGVHPSFDVQTIHKNDFRPRVAGLAFMPNGKLLVTTWDTVGGVYLLDNVASGDTNRITVKRIAAGLAEPLGVEVVNGQIFVLQKQELTQLIDHDKDEVIDEYRAICNNWGVTGDFHEFAFGLVYKDGYFYATLSMAMRLMSNEKQKPDRGKTIKIGMDGTYEWINYGLRTPNGIGLGPGDELFVADNQGEWVPANKLVHVKKGEYHGMRWGHLDSANEPPEVALPAIYLPEDEIGNSPSEPVLIRDGPYKGQMLHGDVTYGGIQRDFLEKVDGDFQGAVFHFTQGLEAGVNRLRWGPDNALYIGGVGMVGGWSWKEKQYGLQKLTYNRRPVFEMLAVRAKPKGFEIQFTDPIADTAKVNPSDFVVEQWWYLPTQEYGGPKMNHEKLKVSTLSISADRKLLYLELPRMKENRVVYLRLPKHMKSSRGQLLWSGETWYTLNKIPRLNEEDVK